MPTATHQPRAECQTSGKQVFSRHSFRLYRKGLLQCSWSPTAPVVVLTHHEIIDSVNSIKVQVKKVKFSLCLIKRYAMKTWGSGGIAPPFFTSVLDGGEWSASQPGRFTPLGKSPRYPMDRGLGGPQRRSGRCHVMSWIEPRPSSP
jgi:hypothetical protein